MRTYPTDEEFEAVVRRFERYQEIPTRLRDIERYLLAIKDIADDYRNRPHMRRDKNGDLYQAGPSVDFLLERVHSIREIFARGDDHYPIAVGLMRTLENKLQDLNALPRRGGAATSKIERDMEFARKCFEHPKWGQSNQQEKATIRRSVAREYGLSNDAARTAFRKGEIALRTQAE